MVVAGMTRDDLFNTNASVARDLAKVIADACPKALVGIITNPVNSCVPIAAEVLNKVSPSPDGRWPKLITTNLF